MPFAQGLGFAVPVDTAYDVISRLTESHRRTLNAGVLGISGLEYTLEATVVRDNHLEQQNGVLLLEVAPRSAADQASLRSGDIILALDGHTTGSVENLRRAVQQLQGHSPWRVAFLREGRRRQVSLMPRQ